MNKHFSRYKNLFFYFLTFSIGIVLFYFAFRHQPIVPLWQEIQQVNYIWSIPVLAATLLNHWMRAYRWKILIKTYHTGPLRLSYVFVAMMLGYFVNIAVPRLGEASRCVALKKSAKVPFLPTLGSVITERALDIASLFLVVVIVFFWQFEPLFTFFQQHIVQPVARLLSTHTSFYLLLVVLVAAVLALLYGLRYCLPALLQQFIQPIMTGLSSLFQLSRKEFLKTILLTVGLWVTYWLMSYLWFRSVAATAHLGIEVAFSLLAVGSLARSIPIQGGGMGAYHFLASQLLALYGVATLHALTLVTVIHAFQTLFYLVVGGICLAIQFFLPPPSSTP